MSQQNAATLHQFEAARLELARLKRAESGSFTRLLDRALEICSRSLKVGRVGVWLLDEALPGLRCLHLYDTEDPSARAGEALLQHELGAYVRALRERSYIASRDVRANPYTEPLAASYFAGHRIVSTLDVPLYRDGEVFGVLCHELRAQPREWAASEAAFAQCVSEIIAHALTTEDLLRAQDAVSTIERERLEALRTEALARVARGIAHDLGSALQGVMLQAETLRIAADDAASVAEVAGRILDLGRHARNILKGLRDYAEGDEESPSPVNVDVALDRARETLRALAGEQRAVTVTPGAPGVVVMVSPTGLERALANLVVNAREATGPGGVIAVASRADAASAFVEVRDDGRGMDEETRARAFEPYFTTHTDQAQRGFGLSIVAGVARAAGGEVTVESAPGEGARFVIRLPRAPRDGV